MKRLFGRTLASSLLIFAACLVTSVAVLMIAIQLFGTKPVLKAVACELNLSQDCLLNDLRQERQRLENERQKRKSEEQKRRRLQERVAELQKIEQRAKELEVLYRRLAQLDHAASSYVIFHTQSFGRNAVWTGHQFASLLNPGTLQKGWCYIDLANAKGLSQNLYIARFEKDLRVNNTRVSRRALREAGLSQADVRRARGLCRWLKRVST